jgi:hypothetical protein
VPLLFLIAAGCPVGVSQAPSVVEPAAAAARQAVVEQALRRQLRQHYHTEIELLRTQHFRGREGRLVQLTLFYFNGYESCI